MWNDENRAVRQVKANIETSLLNCSSDLDRPATPHTEDARIRRFGSLVRVKVWTVASISTIDSTLRLLLLENFFLVSERLFL